MGRQAISSDCCLDVCQALEAHCGGALRIKGSHALHLVICMRRITVACWADGLVPRLGSLAPPVCCSKACTSTPIPICLHSGL